MKILIISTPSGKIPDIEKLLHDCGFHSVDGESVSIEFSTIKHPEPPHFPTQKKYKNTHASFRSIPVPKKIGTGKGKKL